MNAAILDYTRTEPVANVALIREYTDRTEAMARTLDDILALPETKEKSCH